MLREMFGSREYKSSQTPFPRNSRHQSKQMEQKWKTAREWVKKKHDGVWKQ